MADFSLGATFFRRAVWGASPKSWLSPLGEVLKVSGPGRARHECHGAAGAGGGGPPPPGTASGCGLCPAQFWGTAGVLSPKCCRPPISVPPARHPTRVGPQPVIQELSEKESKFRTSDLHGRVFHMGLDSTQCDFSFPLNLIQVGTRFFLVDHSCPDVAIFFFMFL